MKVWLPTLRVGTGADVFVERLAAGLERAGHEAAVQWFPPHFELHPWSLRRVPAPPGTDVIHASSWPGFAFRRPGLPLVVTEHHYVHHPRFAPYRTLPQRLYHDLFIRACLRLSYARADALVAVSHNTAEAMRQDYPALDVDVVHNWIDTTTFQPLAQPRVRAPGTPFRLLFVGNPSRRKGADLLPQLATMLGPEFELLCLGGLRSDVKTATPPANMRLLPRTPPEGMPDLYRSVDAVVVLARYEAFGFVALEAMACGVPLLGFDSTGTSEICPPGEAGLLAPVDDLEQLCADARALAADPARCLALGAAGRRRAVARFNEADGIAAYVDIYRRAMAGRR